jgi:pyruvate dehydrogenase E2 component (dihydrolipoyllysine-residue acetyltransferase)
VATSVTLPKMGESVVEGTIIRWLKQEGEFVKEDEPLVEISTDKIDAEMPAPASGVLKKIVAQPDETVEVGAEIAVIDEGASEGQASPAEEKEDQPAAEKKEEEAPPKEEAPAKEEAPPKEDKPKEEKPKETPKQEQAPPKKEQPAKEQPAAAAPESGGDGGVTSPLVRKLARERGVDLSAIHGTGTGGRVTKDDVLAAAGGNGGAREAPAAPRAPAAPAPPTSVYTVPTAASEDVPFSRIRKAIAEHMSRSRRTAADVTNVVEVDMTRIAQLRARAKASFEKAEGFSLTFLPFVAQAVVQALRAFPEFNAHILEDGASARLFRQVNLGIAVGRDEGLIVPVVHGADGMNLIGIARGIRDVATRAREKGGLKPDDVAGGTFTITNYGSVGGVIDTPIISQPQVAILGTGAIVKRPAVITVDGADAIAIRHMMFLSLSYDHRWVDGHKAAQFNSRIKDLLEEGDFAQELGIAPD